MQVPDVETSYPTLPDRWEQGGRIPLDGVLERNSFPPWVAALLALIAVFLVFQVVGAVAGFVIIVAQGADLSQGMEQLPAMMEEYAGEFLVGNTIGQVIGLGLLTLLFLRMHSSRPFAFARVRKPDAAMLVLGVVGLFVLMPSVQWLVTLNEGLPIPEWLRELQEQQAQFLERILGGDFQVTFVLAMLALTPALFEEFFFRGYFQRLLERTGGPAVAIVLTGVIFGSFHLNPLQVLPLSTLGIYLAYLSWRTGSLWIPVAVHFANNGFAVVAAAYVESRPDLDLAALEEMQVPGYLVVLSILLFAGVVYGLQFRARMLLRTDEPTSVSL